MIARRVPGRTRAIAVLAAGALLALGACTDVPSGADVPFSIAFERLPFPAVVAGDLLRDSAGTAAPLEAVAYNTDDAPISGAAIEYLFVGDGAVLEEGALVRGVTAGDTARITAIAGGIPSLPQLLHVVQRPDSLAPPTDAPAAVTWGLPPNPNTDRSEPITVRVLDAAGQPVRAWIVRYRLEVDGTTLAPDDTSLAWLVDDANRRSAIDTTDATGTAGRRVRVNALNPAIDALASVMVSVTTLGTTSPLRGAPVRVVVPVAPR